MFLVCFSVVIMCEHRYRPFRENYPHGRIVSIIFEYCRMCLYNICVCDKSFITSLKTCSLINISIIYKYVL